MRHYHLSLEDDIDDSKNWCLLHMEQVNCPMDLFFMYVQFYRIITVEELNLKF